MSSARLMNCVLCFVLLTWQLAFASLATAQQSDSSDKVPAYLEPSLPIDKRVDDLVSRMTVEEKVTQVVHTAKMIPRLKISSYEWWSESLHGVASGSATVFPEPIGLAATFDPASVREMGIAIGTEARAKFHENIRKGDYKTLGLDYWAPNVNIFRDPRWGRGQETYGEDPFLTGKMGTAFVRGMQGDDLKYFRVIATPKHFAVHSGPEPTRHTMDVTVNKHDELDTYLPAFRAAIIEGKADSIMCAYNRVNGFPACASPFLLLEQLREKWKFEGYVVSDCDAVEDIFRGHHYVKTSPEAAALSMRLGVDLDCADTGDDSKKYLDAVKQGLLTEAELDVSVKRLMTARFKLGLFDPPASVPYAQIPFSENRSAAHKQLALKLARESMVLLKNNGILPLDASKKQNILVVGPYADSLRILEGNYNGFPDVYTTPIEGIKKAFPNAKVEYQPGTSFQRVGATVPAEDLVTASGKPGLDAEYFHGQNLEGTPIKRVDPDINFDFVAMGGVKDMGSTDFSVRWTGFFVAPETGKYQIGFAGDDGYRLWLDGKLIVEDWANHGVTIKYADLDVIKGHKYAIKAEYYQGGGGAVARLQWVAPGRNDVPAPIEQAKASDVVIAVVGISPDLEGEEMTVTETGFKGGDRTSIDLPEPEQKLLEAMKSTGKPMVVVLTNGSALSVNWAEKNADAILDSWYSGEEGGTAIGETLSGANNPSGKLPLTFYTGVDQLPPFEDYAMKNRTYRYFTGKPLYPFGYGLSYSKFTVNHVKLSKRTLKAGEGLETEAEVKNISKRDGDEVVQVYLSFPRVPGAPVRALRGFQRVSVSAGKTAHVKIQLTPQDLSMVSEAGERVVAPGEYKVCIGGGQPGTGSNAVEEKLTVTGEMKLPE